MRDHNTPSQTAFFSAAARAAHKHVDAPPHLLIDDDAEALCRTQAPSPLDFHLAQPSVPVLAAARYSACARARYADGAIAAAGADQLLIVGAGLDTTHLRLPARSRTHTWTLDKPGVLIWRQQVFAEAEVGDCTTHVPLDLTDGLGAGDLQGCGLDLEAPVVIVWLGVSMYLDPHDLRQFLADLAGLAPGSTLIFDYHKDNRTFALWNSSAS